MGCMAFSHGYGKIPTEEYSIEAIRNGFEHGCTFFDTAEVYSPGLSGIGHNELIVGKALKGVRDNAVIATKLFLRVSAFGSVYGTVRRHLEASLKRLQTDRVDIYYLHRMGTSILHQQSDFFIVRLLFFLQNFRAAAFLVRQPLYLFYLLCI